MPHLLVQSSLHYWTNIPEDVAVNTWHFDAQGGNLLEMAEEVTDMVSDWWLEPAPGVANEPGRYISSVVRRDLGGLSFKVYDMSQPRPRVPIYQRAATLPAPGNANCLPLEVAVCNSFAAERQAGSSPARRRGRVFIGPLSVQAVTQGSSSSFPEVQEAVRTSLTLQSMRMASISRPDLTWSVYSRADQSLHGIWSGWVDNEPDTQRRRQAKATDRTTWTLGV